MKKLILSMLVALGLLFTPSCSKEKENTSIETSVEKVEIDQYGGEKTFDVKVIGSDENWSASSDADWITLTPKENNSKLTITVQKNSDKKMRKSQIIISAGKAKKNIEVIQSGILYYLTPFLKIGSSMDTINKFELDRKSAVTEVHEDGDWWKFQTQSPLFTTITYKVRNNQYYSSTTIITDEELFQSELVEFKEYLLSQGFEEESDTTFYNVKYGLKAEIHIESDNTYVEYTYRPKQDRAYPTFTLFPYGYLGWGSTKSSIDAYEASNGGTYNSEISQTGYLFYDNDNTAMYGRAYFVRDEGLKETAQYYLDKELAFFTDSIFEEPYFTEEFLSLCQREGFVYTGFDRWHRFRDEGRGLDMALRWVHYSEIGFPVIDIHLFRLSGED